MKTGNNSTLKTIVLMAVNIVHPFKIDNRIKKNIDNYSQFLEIMYMLWYKSQPKSFQLTTVFM